VVPFQKEEEERYVYTVFIHLVDGRCCTESGKEVVTHSAVRVTERIEGSVGTTNLCLSFSSKIRKNRPTIFWTG
jgi:hypothetical protein